MIRLENIVYGYDDNEILHGVSFHIPPGESRVIMGPSGSGKSTILRLVLGLDCPWSGDIFIDGRNICGLKFKQLQKMRQQIAMVFQDGALFDSMTVGENVGYYLLEYAKKKGAEIERDVLEMLNFVDLDPEIIDKLPGELSGGMRRRVAVARALLSTNPKIMLFDEPTTGLDPQATESVLNLMIKLQEVKKISVIIVTHQIADAIKLTDKYIIINQGRVVFDGDLEQMRQSDSAEVENFLAPFRDSVAEVVKKKLV